MATTAVAAFSVAPLLALAAPAGWPGFEEIIVTARKREERMQDTPIAMTTFTAAAIEAHNFANLSDITRQTPNLIFDTGTGNTGGSTNAQIFIRGIGQTDFLFTSDPGVGIYVDEVYFPRAVGSVLELLDFERIEVLRGPQGTLFGKNTIGGAISITAQKPGHEFGGYLELKTGSRDRFDARLSLDIPLVGEQLSARVSGMARRQDGYVKRPLANDSLGGADSQSGRLALRWTPGDDFEINFAIDGTRRREGAAAEELVAVREHNPNDLILGLWNLLVAPTYAAKFGPDVAYDSRWLSAPGTSNGTGPGFSDLDAWGTSLTVQKSFAGFYAKSITAYRDQKAKFGLDQDHSPLRYLETTNDNKDKYFSEELQLGGDSLAGRLKWVVGGYYFHEKGTDIFDVALGAGLFDALQHLPAPLIPLDPRAICPPPPGFPPLCAGGFGNPMNVMLDTEATITDAIKINSYAVYSQATFELTDRLSLTGGLRYTYEEKDFTTMLRRNASGVVTVPETTLNRHWDAVTPRAGIEFKLTPDFMTYFSASRGFKSGGFNGRAQSVGEIDSFAPEYVWAYEVGLKSEWLERRLRINAALFHSDYKDMQLTATRAVDGLFTVVTENAGKSRVQGFEVEVAALPAPGLSISGAVGYTDAKFTELAPNATVTLDSRFPKVPKWTMNGAVQYVFPVGNAGAVTVGADISHRSSFFNDVENSPTAFDGGVTLIGAQLAYSPPSESWRITVFGTNLTDARYIINGLNSFGSFGTATASFARPREWGLAVKATF